MALMYNCCFCFSLRLSGVIIALFSTLQAIMVITSTCLAYNNIYKTKEYISHWIDTVKLNMAKGFLENVLYDTEKYLTVIISLMSVYCGLCLLYIYGAITFAIIPMIGFISAELIRLIALTFLSVICLLIIKHNFVDIGILIGASIMTGFMLLGLFYLWLCAANLPILIIEKEKDEHEAIVVKLSRNRNKSNVRRQFDNDGPYY